jgi:integrase
MARGINRLSGTHVRNSRPGSLFDGGGLVLQTTETKDGGRARSWIFRFTRGGRTRHMGLGSVITVDLKTAREKARKCREMLLDGIDPIEHRDRERAAKIAENARSITFEQAAAAYIAAHRDEWRSHQHAAEWPTSLRNHVFPTLGKIDVAAIDTALVVKALKAVWENAPETGSRLRGRIEAVLDWAAVSGFRRPGDNPARWGGHLEYLLAAPRKRQIEHHPAMPYRDVPAFVTQLRAANTPAALAFEFLVLTAARAGEVRGMTWDEIDLDEAVWAVPSSRMKSGREHRVALSSRCVEILKQARAIGHSEFVFPGRDGKLGESAFQHLLRYLGHRHVTVHGFRSSFRDWAGEHTNFPREVCEAALAHAVGNAVERSYRRGDALEKRRRLMETWSKFCSTPTISGEVLPLRSVR